MGTVREGEAMDVYHFVKGATAAFRDNAQRLKGLEFVHFETALVGPWDHITIIWDADVATAHEVIVELNSPGQSPPNAEDRPLDATTAVATAVKENFGPTRIRRSYHEAYEAYALITSTRCSEDAAGRKSATSRRWRKENRKLASSAQQLEPLACVAL
jgi:hypothetical protein